MTKTRVICNECGGMGNAECSDGVEEFTVECSACGGSQYVWRDLDDGVARELEYHREMLRILCEPDRPSKLDKWLGIASLVGLVFFVAANILLSVFGK